MNISVGLRQWFVIVFDKKSADVDTSVGAVKSEIMLNWQLAEELYKPIFSSFGKRKVYSFF